MNSDGLKSGVENEINPEIWGWCRGFYKVYLEDSNIKRRIVSWKGCNEHCKYFHPNGRLGWDIIFPSRYYDKIAKLVSLPLKSKNLNRMMLGQKLGIVAKMEDRLKIKKGYEFSNG